jgi:hypothetical protein
MYEVNEFLIITFDTESTNLTNMYINNILENSYTLSGLTSFVGGMYIPVFGYDSNTNYWLDGAIDNIVTYNKALSETERTQIVENGRYSNSPIRDDIVFEYTGRYYDGTEATPTNFIDMSGCGVQKLYINGELQDYNVDYILTYEGGSNVYRIGADNQLSYNNNGIVIGRVWVFNKELTTTEQEDMNNPFYITDLSYWNEPDAEVTEHGDYVSWEEQ